LVSVQRLGAGEHPAVLHRQLVGGVEPQLVAALWASHIIRKVVSVSMLIPRTGSIWTATLSDMGAPGLWTFDASS
jgi:hypothetical protein